MTNEEKTDLLKHFFLVAARKTYAGGIVPKTTIKEFPGSEAYYYEAEKLLYIDCYFSSKTRSYGQTTIWFDGIPVWGMQYYGEWNCDNERIVIPFLKKALFMAYENLEFIGGRGPCRFNEGDLHYTNASIGDFTGFQGEESIYDYEQSSRRVFWHRYAGMLL